MFAKVCLETFKRIILIWVIFSSKLKYFPNYIALAPFGAIIKDVFDCAACGTNQCEHTTSRTGCRGKTSYFSTINAQKSIKYFQENHKIQFEIIVSLHTIHITYKTI